MRAKTIKKLTRQAYPGAKPSPTDILALDQFIDVMPDPEIRLRLRETRPRDITDAEILSIRLETYRLADTQKNQNAVNAINSNGNIETKGKLAGLLEKLNNNKEKLEKATNRQSQSPPFNGTNRENRNQGNNQKSNGWRSHNPNYRGPNHARNTYGENNNFWRNQNNNGSPTSNGTKKGNSGSGSQQQS